MPFRTDKQTLSDLQIFDFNDHGYSVFDFYNSTETIGGEKLLLDMMQSPTNSTQTIQARHEEIKFFSHLRATLSLSKKKCDFVEYYLTLDRPPLKSNFIDVVSSIFESKLKRSNDLYVIREGIHHIGNLFLGLKELIRVANESGVPKSLEKPFRDFTEYIAQKPIFIFVNSIPLESSEISQKQLNKLDSLFRNKQDNTLRTILSLIYKIDVLQSLSRGMKEHGLTLPVFVEIDDMHFNIENGFHPLLKNGVPYSFKLNNRNSVLLLTGPNMAGKSTFLKTIGVVFYMAHLGFPVTANKLEIPLRSGLYSSINVIDNLNAGLSHFYSEVHRLKKLSLELQKDQSLVIILDELFRGTNVKDAYDGTVQLMKLFSQIKGAIFFISTHILEAISQLTHLETLSFHCFEPQLVNGQPKYNYILKSGVTKQRLGMQIIKSEKIEKVLTDIIINQKD